MQKSAITKHYIKDDTKRGRQIILNNFWGTYSIQEEKDTREIAFYVNERTVYDY